MKSGLNKQNYSATMVY